MKKLISVCFLIFAGFCAVSLMRLVFNLATGPMKYFHFYPFGSTNVIELGIIIAVVIAILNTLLKED
jgi:hypothetical protein